MRIDPESGMTTDERAVADLLVAAWDGYVGLEAMHPDDVAEFAAALHRLQDLLAARVARRYFPGYWLSPALPSDGETGETPGENG